MRHLAFFVVLGLLAAQDVRLTNAQVVDLVNADLQEHTILTIIDTSKVSFDTSANGLIALKKAGVSDRLIQRMIVAGRRREPAAPKLHGSMPVEPGVYAVIDGALKAVKTEIVGWRDGISRTVAQPRSAFRLKTPVAFILLSPDQVTAEDFVLLQFFTKRDRREFRTVAAGSYGRGDGPERMRVPFQSQSIATNTYWVRIVALPRGEYGFVPPGAFLKQNAAAGDIVFTFGID